ncbi:MAG TPA: sigma-70 family RNA polymerase sigma factor [Planctomycetota bacterium]|nr:sigma-70 family RNA polymerase sigma factor [Planctomycetota bacterium]
MTEDLDVHLRAIQSGDARAFELWLVAAEPSLRRGLRSFARDVDVEAVLQEALLRTWQFAVRLKPDGGPNGLVRLAQRIARNLAIDEARRVRATPTDPAVLAAALDESPRFDSAPSDPRLHLQITRCREKLPARPKEALAARLQGEGGEPDATLAARLGMEKNAFLQNIARARKHLLACLKRAGISIRTELA